MQELVIGEENDRKKGRGRRTKLMLTIREEAREEIRTNKGRRFMGSKSVNKGLRVLKKK